MTCLWVFHDWQAMKWGSGRLDARSCQRCGRFQIWSYFAWHTADRDRFPDAKLADVS